MTRPEYEREATAFKAAWRARVQTAAANNPSLREQRDAFDAEHAAVPLPEGCRVEPISAGLVRGEFLIPRSAKTGRVLVYHHGGGHAFGSARSHRHLVARLAEAAGAIAYNFDYPLAPEAPFPAGLDQAFSNYEFLLSQGHAPGSIVLGGESAGGNLSAALVLRLKQADYAMPRGLYLLSPWLDLTQGGEAYDRRQEYDPMVSRDLLTALAHSYCGSSKATDPLVSPVFGELSGLPPILIQVGGDEVLLGDSTRFAHEAALAGDAVELAVWPGMVHAWPLFHWMMPCSGAAAIAQAGAWIRSRLEG